MRIRHWGTALILAVASLAAFAVQGRAEIHNGGVDCTNWNGVYKLVGSSAKDRSLLPPANDTIEIKQDSCGGCDMLVNIGGEQCLIEARTNNSRNRRPMTVKGRSSIVYASWVDGYGKNWYVSLTPDPLRPNVPYSVREFSLTSFHTVTMLATIHNPHKLIPLATFSQTGGRTRGGQKIQDVVDARAVYLLPVGERG